MPFDEKSRDSTLRNYLLAGGMRGSGSEKRKKNNIFLLDWKSSINIIELKTRFGSQAGFLSHPINAILTKEGLKLPPRSNNV